MPKKLHAGGAGPVTPAKAQSPADLANTYGVFKSDHYRLKAVRIDTVMNGLVAIVQAIARSRWLSWAVLYSVYCLFQHTP